MKKTLIILFLLIVTDSIVFCQFKPSWFIQAGAGNTFFTADKYTRGIEFNAGIFTDIDIRGKKKKDMPSSQTGELSFTYLSAPLSKNDSISLKRIELTAVIHRNFGISENVFFNLQYGIGLGYYFFGYDTKSKPTGSAYDNKMGTPLILGLGLDIYLGGFSIYIEDKFKIDLVTDNIFSWKGAEFRLNNFTGAGLRIRI